MYECRCPYCGESMDDPDDSYEEGVIYDHECPHCEKNFVFEVSYIRTYSERKADCLNGGKHDFKPTSTYPREYTRMRCGHCGGERKCTEDEMAQVMSGHKGVR